MFYPEVVLRHGGGLAKLWLAAHYYKKLKKREILQTDLGECCDAIMMILNRQEGGMRFSLRTSSYLAYGAVRLHNSQWASLLGDADALIKSIDQMNDEPDEGPDKPDKRKRRARRPRRPRVPPVAAGTLTDQQVTDLLDNEEVVPPGGDLVPPLDVSQEELDRRAALVTMIEPDPIREPEDIPVAENPDDVPIMTPEALKEFLDESRQKRAEEERLRREQEPQVPSTDGVATNGEVVPPPEATPQRPEATPPRPEATPPRPEATPPRPEATPPRPEATPPRPEATPPRPEATPPRPEATPPRPEATPPRSGATPPRTEVTPPRPEVTPEGAEAAEEEPAQTKPKRKRARKQRTFKDEVTRIPREEFAEHLRNPGNQSFNHMRDNRAVPKRAQLTAAQLLYHPIHFPEHYYLIDNLEQLRQEMHRLIDNGRQVPWDHRPPVEIGEAPPIEDRPPVESEEAPQIAPPVEIEEAPPIAPPLEIEEAPQIAPPLEIEEAPPIEDRPQVQIEEAPQIEDRDGDRPIDLVRPSDVGLEPSLQVSESAMSPRPPEDVSVVSGAQSILAPIVDTTTTTLDQVDDAANESLVAVSSPAASCRPTMRSPYSENMEPPSDVSAEAKSKDSEAEEDHRRWMRWTRKEIRRLLTQNGGTGMTSFFTMCPRETTHWTKALEIFICLLELCETGVIVTTQEMVFADIMIFPTYMIWESE